MFDCHLPLHSLDLASCCVLSKTENTSFLVIWLFGLGYLVILGWSQNLVKLNAAKYTKTETKLTVGLKFLQML